MPAGADYSTIEIKVSFLKAIRADGGEIEVVGRALQVGRRVAFAEAHARNSRGDLVGHATASFAVSGAREGKE
jgi:acyl-coenzyme A thioesterase PaaI-like protein